MGIGMSLKNLLKEKKMTMQELSRLSGISINTLYGIVKRDNNTVQPEILDKLSSSLNIPAYQLIGLDKNEAINQAATYKEFGDIMIDADEIEEGLLLLQDLFTQKMKELFESLNEAGKEEAIKRIKELTQLSQYKKL